MSYPIDQQRSDSNRLAQAGHQGQSRLNDVMTSQNSVWPGGWYVFEAGQVSGPMSAEQAFSLGSQAADGKPRLVSRKGFSQWYPMADLSEIFRLTDQMGRRVEMERAKASIVMPAQPEQGEALSMMEQIARFSALQNIAISPSLQPPARRNLGADQAAHAKVARPVHPEKSSSKVPPYVEAEARARWVIPTPDAVRREEPVSASEAAPGSQIVPVSKRDLMTEYFLQRGKMRLGKVRQPWLTGFIAVPLSLGIYWYVWFREMVQELTFHTQNEQPNIPPAIFALIPIVHIFMTYRLAALMRKMEEQNKYSTISPGLAALFALIPPFALTYLQDGANRHWMLHARHAAVRRLTHPEKMPF